MSAAQSQEWWLWLEDEVPQVGSGLRLVRVTIGRKWVRLSYPTSMRLAMKRWEGLTKVPAEGRTWGEVLADLHRAARSVVPGYRADGRTKAGRAQRSIGA